MATFHVLGPDRAGAAGWGTGGERGVDGGAYAGGGAGVDAGG